MVVLGLILVVLAVGAAGGVLMDNTAPASLEVYSRPVPGGLTTAEVFLTGVVVCAVFMFGFMLIASGIRRSRLRRRELIELRGEHDDTLDSLRYEKEQLERQLMQARSGMGPGGPGPMPGPPGPGPGPGPGPAPGPGGPRGGDMHGGDMRGGDMLATDPRGIDPFADDSRGSDFWSGPPQGAPGIDGPGGSGPGGPRGGRGPYPGPGGPVDTGNPSDVRVAPSSRTYEELSPDADYRY